MDLIAFALSLFESCRENNAATGRVGFDRARESGGVREIEDGLQHFNHVVERMFVVIQNDDVVELAQLIFCTVIDIGV